MRKHYGWLWFKPRDRWIPRSEEMHNDFVRLTKWTYGMLPPAALAFLFLALAPEHSGDWRVPTHPYEILGLMFVAGYTGMVFYFFRLVFKYKKRWVNE